MNWDQCKARFTPRVYKLTAGSIFLCVVLSLFFDQILYLSYLVGIYPAKPQVKDVAFEFNGNWMPAISTESPLRYVVDLKSSGSATLFYKMPWTSVSPSTHENIFVLWVGDNDKYVDLSQVGTPKSSYSQMVSFDWGNAYIVKHTLYKDPSKVIAFVPDFDIQFSVDNLEQLKEIKSIKKIGFQ